MSCMAAEVMLKELWREWASQVRDFDACMNSDLNYSSFLRQPFKVPYVIVGPQAQGLTLAFMFGGDGRAEVRKDAFIQ